MSNIGKLYTSIKDPLADMTGDELLGYVEGDDALGFIEGDESLGFIEGDDDSLGDATLQVIGDDDSLGAFATEILGGDDEAGAWLHKLNPTYWFKSSEEKDLLDREKEEGKTHAENRKELAEKQKVLAQAERTAATAAAAKKVAEDTKATEEKLNAVKAQLTGVGDMPMMENINRAISAMRRVRHGAHHVARNMAQKIAAGQPLSQDDLRALKKVMQHHHGVKKFMKNLKGALASVNGDSMFVDGDFVGYRDDKGAESDFLGAYATEILGDDDSLGAYATEILGDDDSLGAFVGDDSLGDDFLGGQYPKKVWLALTAIAATKPQNLKPFMAKKGIVLDATQVKHLKNLQFLTRVAMAKKVGRPIKGGVPGRMAGDDMGGLWDWTKKIASVAVLPLAGAAWLAYKGAQYAGKGVSWAYRKVTGQSDDSPPPPPPAPGAPPPPPPPGIDMRASRLARIRAIRRRRRAAWLRRKAAQAASADARAEMLEKARAADAEASAAQAEANAAEANERANEEQAPTEAPVPDDQPEDSDESGTFIGASAFIGGWVEGIENPRVRRIVQAAGTDSMLGKKIRAGATVVAKAKAGQPAAKAAIKKVVAKAKAGDPQAKRDANALKAGHVALVAKKKATIKARVQAANKKGIAVRNTLQNKLGDTLARASRRKALNKVAKVERAAATGNRKAKAVIAKTVAKAQAGDKKAKTAVAALKLVKHVRVSAKTPHEAKNLKTAAVVVKKALKGNKAAIKKVRIIQAAAKKGQPNAKRAVARMQTVAKLEKAVRTGKILPVKAKAGTHDAAWRTRSEAQLARLIAKARAGKASREEVILAAKLANELGKKKEAAELAFASRKFAPATAKIKKAAAVAAASQAGHPEAKAIVANVQKQAEAGNPEGISAAGHLAAVNAIDAVNKGQQMDPKIAEATSIVEREKAGDPEAKRIIERAHTAATTPNEETGKVDPKAVQAAVALTAAAATAAALASRPGAHEEWKDKAAEVRGQKFTSAESADASKELTGLYAKVQEGTATRAEAEKARELAMALKKPAMAAEISALTPTEHGAEDVLSSMPDIPLPAITGPGSFLKEALRALFFATPDPLANYREGIQSRGSATAVPGTAVETPEASSGAFVGRGQRRTIWIGFAYAISKVVSPKLRRWTRADYQRALAAGTRFLQGNSKRAQSMLTAHLKYQGITVA